jgi:hypothetical protein
VTSRRGGRCGRSCRRRTPGTRTRRGRPRSS